MVGTPERRSKLERGTDAPLLAWRQAITFVCHKRQSKCKLEAPGVNILKLNTLNAASQEETPFLQAVIQTSVWLVLNWLNTRMHFPQLVHLKPNSSWSISNEKVKVVNGKQGSTSWDELFIGFYKRAIPWENVLYDIQHFATSSNLVTIKKKGMKLCFVVMLSTMAR